MKAVILAAGKGTRLAAVSGGRPKPMVDVGGKPCLERIVLGLRRSGITDVVMVTGHKAELISDYFGDGSRFDIRITYVHQAEQKGTGQALHLTREAAGAAPFLMTYGDILIDPEGYAGMMAAFRQRQAHAVLGLNWVDDPYRGAAVYLDADDRVQRIVEKPPQGTSTTNWNNAGVYVFDPVIFDYTAKLQPSPRGEYELTDAIHAMLTANLRVWGYRLRGVWRDIGTPDDLAAAQTLFSEP